ncbi:MAG TPA: hypothetical protein PLY88_06255 [Candidatus Omnitrophota bacterium]|nr:hypothetical protein [Candidatus Omnitrophota bacterium]
MPLKTSVVADFDSRRELFHKVVGSLNLLSPSDKWDLSWGEPFLALSRDRKLWVRIFYEESLPITAERLRAESDRLKPHISEGGRLVLCIPENWAQGLGHEGLSTDFPVRVWIYSHLADGRVVTRELDSVTEPKDSLASMVSNQDRESEEKLSSDEIRELTEIGVELKRYALKKAG